jgi:peptidoglycan-N-acetylglucosamine deacetylase
MRNFQIISLAFLASVGACLAGFWFFRPVLGQAPPPKSPIGASIVNSPLPVPTPFPQPAVRIPIPTRFQGKRFEGAKIDEKVVALTFDDGPWPISTLKILETLKQNQIRATFFCLGGAIEQHPELLQAIFADGHIVSNHTWHHRYRRMSRVESAAEIDNTTALIKKVTGAEVNLFRPPGGILNNGVAAYAAKKGYSVVLWTVVSGDTYRGMTPDRMANKVISLVRPGGVVLMHDGGGRHPTSVALPKIVAGLKKKGYRFVTIPELMDLQQEAWDMADLKEAARRFALTMPKATLPTGASQ